MKAILVSIIFLVLTMGLMGQITITQNDMPDIGDTMRYSTGINLSGYDFTLTGNNYTWDFTGLTPVVQTVDTFVSVSSTPFWYQLVFIYPLVATIAKPLGEFNQVPGFQATDIYEFYKEAASYFSLAGYAVTLNSIPLPVKFNQPDYIYKFPMNPGNQDSCTSSYEIDIPGIGYVGGWKKRHNNIDGWGTLITPFGEFQTLRIKSEIEQYDSLYVDSIGTGMPLYRNYTEYKWLGNGMGQPLLQYTSDDLAPVILYMDSVRNLIVNIAEDKKAGTSVLIYPNPANDYFSAVINGCNDPQARMEILDINGIKQRSFEISTGQGSDSIIEKIPLSGLQPGVYVIITEFNGQRFMNRLMVR